MTLQTVIQATKELRDDFVRDGTPTPCINRGLCADFADALASALHKQGVEVRISSLDSYWSEDGGADADAPRRRDHAALPPGIDWPQLTALGFADAASHTWIEFEGLCFDAEKPEGVASPFEFPCIRHAFTEVLDGPKMAALTAEHAWWVGSLAIRAERELVFAGQETGLRP